MVTSVCAHFLFFKSRFGPECENTPRLMKFRCTRNLTASHPEPISWLLNFRKTGEKKSQKFCHVGPAEPFPYVKKSANHFASNFATERNGAIWLGFSTDEFGLMESSRCLSTDTPWLQMVSCCVRKMVVCQRMHLIDKQFRRRLRRRTRLRIEPVATVVLGCQGTTAWFEF